MDLQYNCLSPHHYCLLLFCTVKHHKNTNSNNSVLFIAILIAQLYQSFFELTKEAHVNVIMKKTEIMQQMDELLMCLPCCHKCVSEFFYVSGMTIQHCIWSRCTMSTAAARKAPRSGRSKHTDYQMFYALISLLAYCIEWQYSPCYRKWSE